MLSIKWLPFCLSPNVFIYRYVLIHHYHLILSISTFRPGHDDSPGQSRQRLTGSATPRRQSATASGRSSRNSIHPTYEDDPQIVADLAIAPTLSYEDEPLPRAEVVEQDLYADQDVVNMDYSEPPSIALGHQAWGQI